MKYYISLITNKQHNSNIIKRTRIQSPITPTDAKFQEWRIESLRAFINKEDVLPMFIEYNYDDFVKVIKKLYRIIQKNISIEKDEENEKSLLFRIPTKQGAFFEHIDHITLYSDEYKSNIAVIKVKM